MCGILFLLQPTSSVDSQDEEAFKSVFEKLKTTNAARGPDAQETVTTSTGNLELTYFGSELRLRGDAFIRQPHRDEDGNMLCWNGEIFEGLEISLEENDGAVLFSRLCACHTAEDIVDLLGSIEGPYAFVFYHQKLRKLFFARDPLGRRSLLINKPSAESLRLLLTSASIGHSSAYTLEELSTEHIFCLDVESLSRAEDFVSAFPRCLQNLPRQTSSPHKTFAEITRVNRSLPDDPPLPSSLENIPEHLSDAVDQFISLLERSVELRVCSIPKNVDHQRNARVAVLFSGGIDSAILAHLADRHVPPEEPIDLLNVAFENPNRILAKSRSNASKELRNKLGEYSVSDADYNVPDRETGLQELEELRRICPRRTWRFVEVNVPYQEYQSVRPTVECLMFPRRTVMDLSLAMALYFAARGVGQVRRADNGEPEPYTSPARVLLNGLGSDELLGGYGRFQTVFKHGGWSAIVDELQLELDRIPTRNLGRDDRVISCHGKEARHPFLSLSLVTFLAQLPVHLKTDPRLEAGFGEKILLRLAAHKVGLVEASSRKKRAMQFGSRSARISPEDGNAKGDVMLAGPKNVE